MAEIIWTEPALQDLEQIADYIALDKPEAAKKLVRKVFQKVELLQEFPNMCPHPRDLPGTQYRHLILNPLRIFYRIENKKVFIIYIMRTERLLKLNDITKRDS